MKNFTISSIAFIAFIALCTSASAKEAVGNILSVNPIISETYQPQQVCEIVRSDSGAPTSAVNSGSVIGGIAGAILGSQVGGGNGRIAASALGAVTGALTGDRMVQRNNMPQQNCRIVDRPSRQITGYRVTVEWQDDTFEDVLPFDPSNGGSTKAIPIQIRVSIR